MIVEVLNHRGWDTAAAISSAAMGAILFPAHHRACGACVLDRGPRHLQVTSGLNDFSWVVWVVWSFPAAMFAMSGAFGLSRAGIISKRFFSVGVAVVVPVLLGGTTWASDGFWAPAGAFALISRLAMVVWVAVLSGFLALRMPSTARAPERASIPTA